jgi:hypothetical protein
MALYPKAKGRYRCKLLCLGHSLVLLYRPVRYIGVSRGRFRGFDSKTDGRNLLDRKFSPGTEGVAWRKDDVCISEAPDLALCESLYAKYRSLLIVRDRVERLRLHPTPRNGVMPALAKVPARYFTGHRIRSQATQRDAQDNPI